jgi:hypothetical protein
MIEDVLAFILVSVLCFGIGFLAAYFPRREL